MTKHITLAKVRKKENLTSEVVLMELLTPEIAECAESGQFMNVQVTKTVTPFLRRPFGIAGVDKAKGTITIIFRLIGEATHLLGETKIGEFLSIVGPLGHGFDIKAKHPLLVGGGMGLAPLKYLVEKFSAGNVDVLMGGRTKSELFWTELFKNKAEKIFVTTDDGSSGTKGTVAALLPELLKSGKYDCVYVCGPTPMMKAVSEIADINKIPCQVSLEKYMACGLGACLSCSCGGIGKRLKVCTDGPVFWAQEVVEW